MIKLTRTERPVEGIAFVAMPYGQKAISNGDLFHFDELYTEVYVRTIRECSMTAERADRMWGAGEGVLEVVWRGIQRAEVVIVDCTTRSADVSLELGLAMALGKRLVVLAQCLEDIPTDLLGQVRPILYQPAGLGVATMMEKLKEQLQIVRGEAVTENDLVPLTGGVTEPMPGSVVLISRERAVVEADGGHGQLWELGSADVDYARIIRDMTRKFAVGDKLQGAVTDIDGARRYTLLADQSNPWPGIVADYPVGKIFTSRVVNMAEGIGAFLTITGRINGRVPFAEARRAGLVHDAQAEVEVLRVDAAARQVSLRLRKVLTGSPALAVLPPAPATAPAPAPVSVTAGLPAVGARLLGVVTSAVPEQQGRGGFLLLRLKGYETGPRAILHCTQMSQELREDLNDSAVDLINEEIMVQVTQVDPSRRRIALVELPEADQEAAAAAA